MPKEKIKMLFWFSIVIVVVVVLVFITINNKNEIMEEKISNVEERVSKTGDLVSMNYTGRLTDGTVFDSNVDPKFGHLEPFIFTLGAGQVIPGWDKGIVGMKIGEKKLLTIPPEDAYGAAGAGGLIPPNATLIFEVELVDIENED